MDAISTDEVEYNAMLTSLEEVPEVLVKDMEVASNVIIDSGLEDTNFSITSTDLANSSYSVEAETDKKKIALANLNKCHEALDLETSITTAMLSSCFKASNAIIKAEDTCLTMTASGYYDDVFYCSVLQIEVPVRRVYVCRLFESGGFQGYFHNEGQCFIQQRLGLTNDLLPYHVYTMDDVNMEKIRSIKLYQTMRNSGNSY
ncbi:uncharacterized protein LOC130656555 [Hydractinia symbiolongicarpus]|uniref:uncharacterized protein LOC130656555 n=1 Tax=Hydractinia symbiolongicarpus TaxID=13093 RepID=UPI00254CDC2C|nr:uncharacterized protein LOC130656555 [Hydractinia symbiolongicarpus]XP_057315421.1 uncharacterized protein LOC130656555 [Hydractinia symbiolongicarpus]XP_057315422.1 uncharacterized protein LOC130656555 [Hydractinia symbiolongicarpus]